MVDNRKTFYKDGFIFRAPSMIKNKKYDVYFGDIYLTSFGQLKPNGEPYEQYEDKIGFYSTYDHLDPKRQKAYRQRHKKDKIDNPRKAGYFAWHYLW
jgi:hypothetical protein